ncbi:MAG: xanthine dehydrogenase family protein subunit M [Acidobacteria bacterium]|nr:xanthine dehydrogenase family protein subunit M [Acidobacteriota bacterium]
MMGSFSYVRAGSVKQAVAALAHDGARLHAGGTDLLGCLRDRVFDAGSVVSISGIEELGGIAALSGGSVRIGALATLAEIASHPLIRERYPVLAEAAASAASPQLRNQGTIGGNLCQRPRCWYFRGDFICTRKGGSLCYAFDGENRYHCIFGGDGCYIVHPSDAAPALVALDAQVSIAGPGGSRTIAVEDLHILPKQDIRRETSLEAGEIVTEIVVPPPRAGLRSTYRKVRERGSWDFALVSVAIAAVVAAGKVSAARVVLGGVAPKPWRSIAAEAALIGHAIDESAAMRAAAGAVEGAQPLAQNAYKVPLLRGALEEAVMSLARP